MCSLNNIHNNLSSKMMSFSICVNLFFHYCKLGYFCAVEIFTIFANKKKSKSSFMKITASQIFWAAYLKNGKTCKNNSLMKCLQPYNITKLSAHKNNHVYSICEDMLFQLLVLILYFHEMFQYEIGICLQNCIVTFPMTYQKPKWPRLNILMVFHVDTVYRNFIWKILNKV